jgi:hypothetical protein
MPANASAANRCNLRRLRGVKPRPEPAKAMEASVVVGGAAGAAAGAAEGRPMEQPNRSREQSSRRAGDRARPRFAGRMISPRQTAMADNDEAGVGGVVAAAAAAVTADRNAAMAGREVRRRIRRRPADAITRNSRRWTTMRA